MSKQPRFYRRVGLVDARLLDAPHQWTTSGGAVMQGAAGDWLVTSEEAGARTVADESFRASHEHIEGDTWRRFGVVRAYQADESLSVSTPEGLVTAAPGEWIVTDEHGTTWPVRHSVFEATYELLPDGPVGRPRV